MWYPASIAAPATEPVSAAQAYAQCRIASSQESSFTTEITRLIAAARSHTESVCGVRFGVRATVPLKCDSFADFARVPEGPVNSIASISYVDGEGAAQTLSSDVYELRSDNLDTAIVLKHGQVWPSIRPSSRITVTASVGYSTTPEAVVHAMLVWIDDAFHGNEPVEVGGMSLFDILIFNHRRGV